LIGSDLGYFSCNYQPNALNIVFFDFYVNLLLYTSLIESDNEMLAGKLALITGSTSGIGLGIAKVLASKGSNIILNGFGDPQEIKSLCKSLQDTYKVKISYQSADLAKLEDIENMMASVDAGSTGIDILVNNAGIQHVSPIESFAPEKFDLIMKLNLAAVFHTTRLALPYMRTQNWGRIINIASVHGLVASTDK
jgi:3-hydroxybutyrate dehydrogenase